ncbi:MAG: hypothetical protein BGO21_05340 [Dyadobacter sp. 50-39]|uniref:TonB-dependent receptor n=1 Tax=Dyadobacter sp. 50-39 TaxID=1895756 RepID=UPI0009663A07|nr:TonB-dependent receptor [Dyadobacter sp. 50-39]OJV22580.1 MAG: hypothetical protein BGO21_05340 [Dyadobacter sp. 50-39]
MKNCRLSWLLLLIGVTITMSVANAQNTGGVRGQITDETGQALYQAAILLEGTSQGTTTGEDGSFQIPDIAPGDYTVRVTYLGYDAIRRKVKIRSGHIHEMNLQLTSKDELLQTVEITGRKEKDYTNSNTFAGTKTATPIREVPQSIAYVTKEVMADQGAVRMMDIVKNVSGVNQHTFYDDVSIRGFRNQGGVGSSSSTQLFNGLRTFTGFWRQNLINYLERVEVIKGPAAALFGNANPGGTINKVTKKPLEDPRHLVGFQVGSWNTVRMTTDFTGPMNKDKTVLYRLNLGYENAGSFRDLLFDKNIVVAPSLSYLASKKTRLNFDAVYNKSISRLDRGQSVFGSSDLYSTPISLNVADINDYLNEETYLLTASLTHEFSKHISFNASFLRTGYRQDLFEHRSTAFAVDKKGKEIQELAFRRTIRRHNEQFSNSATAYLTADFNTGGVNHKLLGGYDYNTSVIPIGSSQMDAAGYRLLDGTIATRYVVKDSAKYQFYSYKGQMIPRPNVASFDLSTNAHALQNTAGYVETANNTDVVVPFMSQQHSVYLQEQLSWGRLKALLGLRYETYIDKAGYATASVTKIIQHSLLPRIGATYEVSKQVNAYATYAMGYNPQSSSSQNAAAGGPFDPMTSDLLEAGVKSNWLDNRLSITAAVYKITQRNVLYNAQDPDNPDLLVQVGKDQAKGVELDIVGNILPNLSIIATYAYNKAFLSGAQATTDSAYNGQQKPNAPKNQGSIWLKYEMAKGALRGLGLGAGANYVGKRTFGFQGINNITPTKGPDYMLINAGVYYRVKKIQLQLNLNNLTDKIHWVGGYDRSRLYPGAPRNWQTSITYVF